MSNEIINCKALCMTCLKESYRGRPKRRDANFTFCFSNKKSQIEVGEKDKYIAVCMPCHKRLTEMKTSNPNYLQALMSKIKV